MEVAPHNSVLFSSWLTEHGMDAKAQYANTKSGWLERLSKRVYIIKGTSPSLLDAVSSYNTQLDKKCIIGAFSALGLRDIYHYIPMGKPTMYLFTSSKERLPNWMLKKSWEYTVNYCTTSFINEDMLGVEKMNIDNKTLLVSSRERAFLECLYLTNTPQSLMDTYHLMESLTTLRPNLLQRLLEDCNSIKVKRLFLYMAEKTAYPWFNMIKQENIDLGSGRRMISPTGKFIRKYNITIPKELADYE